MRSSQEYYTLGVRYANKIIDAIFSDNPYETLKKIMNHIADREKLYPELVSKESNYFVFNVLTVLIGLNKELIEESNIDFNYEYEFNKKINEKFEEFDKNKYYYFFKKFQTSKGNKYDSWLDVIDNNTNDNDYLFNVRNGILHSEFEPNNLYIYNLRNSNYTGFKSKIYFPCFHDFVLYYFSNSNYENSISLRPQSTYLVYDGEKVKLNNENDFKTFLDKVNTTKYKEDYYLNVKNKLHKKTENQILVSLKNPDLYELIPMNEEEKQTVINYINKNIDYFYSYDFDKQIVLISCIYNLLYNPNFIVSNWITYFMGLSTSYSKHIGFDEYSLNMNFGTGADKVAALFIKLGFILYRLQYQNFEEVDYNLIDIDVSKIRYEEEGNINGISPYVHAHNKILNKYPNYPIDKIEKMIVCDVIRDSIAHGKIDFNVEQNSGELHVVFIDSYKGKKRIITFNIDTLKNFVMSEAFEGKRCFEKKDSLQNEIDSQTISR